MIVMCALVTGTPPTSRQKPAAVKSEALPWRVYSPTPGKDCCTYKMVQGRRQQLFPTAENNNADTHCKTKFSDKLDVHCALIPLLLRWRPRL